MGRQRSQPQPAPQQQATPVETQIAVALLTGAGVAAVAAPLLFVLPPPILADPTLAAEVAAGIARLVTLEPLGIPERVPKSGIVREAALNVAVYRAAYAVAATRRAVMAVAGTDMGESPIEVLRAFLKREAANLRAHQEVSRRRMSAAKATEGMMELHGPILVWRHSATRIPVEPRPLHIAADGKSFDLRRGIPRSTGSLPGVERWCSCAWGPPVAGAVMMM